MATGHLATEYRMLVFLQTFGILEKLLLWVSNEFLELKPHILFERKLCKVRLWLYHARRRVEQRAGQPRLFIASELQQPA